jgi:transmembrane sensor
MTSMESGDALFEAWRAAAPPAVPEAGYARFLEAFAERRARSSAPRHAMRGALVLAAAATFVWWRTPAALTFRTESGTGVAGEWLATEATGDMALTFSEGTHVVLGAGTRGRVEELGRSGATFLLERGDVQAQVVHRGGTSWRFRAGPFDVHVTGTKLNVAWNPDQERFAVRVDEGRVVVDGPRTGATQVVRAGEECVFDLGSHTLQVRSTATGVDRAPPEARESREPAPTLVTPPAVPASNGAATALPLPRAPTAALAPWTRLEERGDYAGAYAAASRAGWASVLRASSSDELLRLAQVGQLAGHEDAEREALLTCRRRFPGTEQAAVAAYELGREAERADAAHWFEAYLHEEPGGALAREASGRLVESRAAAGDHEGARSAATQYLARYPTGPHAVLAQRVLREAP